MNAYVHTHNQAGTRGVEREGEKFCQVVEKGAPDCPGVGAEGRPATCLFRVTVPTMRLSQQRGVAAG